MSLVPEKETEMINFRHLEYFVVSADTGSFSKAAEVLYTTQSNISKGVKALERAIGVALFVRQSTGIALTAKGKHVYKYACKIMEDVGALKDFSGEGKVERIHFSMNPSSWLADRFVEFYNRFNMERMLMQTSLVNISGSYFSNEENQTVKSGIPLKREENGVVFGYLKREHEELQEGTEKFLSFIWKELRADV